MSHALDSVGDKFNVPNLHKFIVPWVSLFSHSPKLWALWKDKTGRAMKTYSKTRWWSKWEVMHQLLQQFGDVTPFLNEHCDSSLATRRHLMEILTNPQQLTLVKLELAAVIDIGIHFVQGTYNLEGDGIQVINCYEEIVKIRSAIASKHFPNVKMVATSLFPEEPAKADTLVKYASDCIQPGIHYFEVRYGTDSDFPVSLFKAARLFNPSKVHEMKPVTADVAMVCGVIPFLKDEISNLQD